MNTRINKGFYKASGQPKDNYDSCLKHFDDPYVRLRAAIIQRAADDLKGAILYGDKNEVRRLKKWFLSDWGQAISGNYGKFIIDRIVAECNDIGLDV